MAAPIRQLIAAASLMVMPGLVRADVDGRPPAQDAAGHAPTWQEYQAVLERLEALEQQSIRTAPPAPAGEPVQVREPVLLREPAATQFESTGYESSLSSTSSSAGVAAEAAPPADLVERVVELEQAVKRPMPQIKLSGFFHLDSGYFHQDDNSLDTLGDIQDGVGFRRARLQALGKVTEQTAFSIEFDFAIAGRPSFMDVWVEQQNLPLLGNLRIGQFRTPQSLDSWTGIKQLTFLERSAPFQAFDPFRRVGIMAWDNSRDENWLWAYGLFKTGGFGNAPIGDNRFAADIGDDGGYSGSGRLVRTLFYDEPSDGRYVWAIGGHGDYSINTGSTSSPQFYRAVTIPEFFVGDPAAPGLVTAGTPFFLDTGRIAAKDFQFAGVDHLLSWGPFHTEAEWMFTTVNPTDGPQLCYQGAYVQAGYFLTGENLHFNRQMGAFDKLTPFTNFFGLGRQCTIGGWGAWEVAARWSYLDLSDDNAVVLPDSVARPGILNESTVGLNWYWNPNVKLQANWIHAMLDTNANGDSNTDIFATRCQMQF